MKAKIKINSRILNDLVDSSLKNADLVICDNQEIKGELWIIRYARWDYYPFSFKISYHVLNESAEVLFFQYLDRRKTPNTKPKTIQDTDSYRKLLLDADRWRIKQL